MAEQTIVRILPLSDLLRAIARAQYEFGGRSPSRVAACPVQVRHWEAEAMRMARVAADPSRTELRIMGILVVEGAQDAQPEFVWALPITGAA